MISAPHLTDSDYHKKLQNRSKSIDNLDFIGEVDPHKVHGYYRNAKILVNTSDYEGFPNTFLEAWRYETPVVSLFFDIDSTLSEMEVGMISGNMANLQEDVRSLAHDVSLRSRMGATARKLVANLYSLDTVTNQYKNVFDHVI